MKYHYILDNRAIKVYNQEVPEKLTNRYVLMTEAEEKFFEANSTAEYDADGNQVLLGNQYMYVSHPTVMEVKACKTNVEALEESFNLEDYRQSAYIQIKDRFEQKYAEQMLGGSPFVIDFILEYLMPTRTDASLTDDVMNENLSQFTTLSHELTNEYYDYYYKIESATSKTKIDNILEDYLEIDTGEYNEAVPV